MLTDEVANRLLLTLLEMTDRFAACLSIVVAGRVVEYRTTDVQSHLVMLVV